MRREHDTIVVEVLDELSRLLERPGPFHITVLAARANLPHDRLGGYLEELAAMGLALRDPIPAITGKGRQFLDCYHAWLRIQKLYGLGPQARLAARPPVTQQQASPHQPALLAADGPAAAPAPSPQVVVAHESSWSQAAGERGVRGG